MGVIVGVGEGVGVAGCDVADNTKLVVPAKKPPMALVPYHPVKGMRSQFVLLLAQA